MKISTKGRYALRVMIDLAQHNTGEYITLKSISERQEISVKYLEMIIAILNKAGFVFSSRGKGGGYKLSRVRKDYTVGCILKLTEGNLAPVECLCSKENLCSRAQYCITLPLWQKLDQVIDTFLESVTIEDLINRQKNLIGNDYQI
ncbi:MAG: Rrf2 family transcriptional regulator [Desulfosporosinus sp.]